MEKVKAGLNGRTLTLAYRLIVLGAIGWVGTSIQSHTTKLAEISKDVAVQASEVSAIKAEQIRQSAAIQQIQFDLGRRAPQPKIKP